MGRASDGGRTVASRRVWRLLSHRRRCHRRPSPPPSIYRYLRTLSALLRPDAVAARRPVSRGRARAVHQRGRSREARGDGQTRHRSDGGTCSRCSGTPSVGCEAPVQMRRGKRMRGGYRCTVCGRSVRSRRGTGRERDVPVQKLQGTASRCLCVSRQCKPMVKLF